MTKSVIICHIRKIPIECTPEECVRQAIVQELLHRGYPISCIAIEKGVRDLCIDQPSQRLPLRRIDIACYGRDSKGNIRPLLIIECKAVPLNHSMLRQVFGYNTYIKAPFVALAGKGQFLLMPALQKESNEYFTHIPDYIELQQKAQNFFGE